MAAKKKTTRSRAKPPSATAEGRFSILMEQMQEQNRATIEAVQSLDQKIMRRLDETDQRNEVRFQSLEAAVRMNSELIRKNSEAIGKNTDAIAKNAEAIAKNADAIAKNADAIAKNTDAIAKNTEVLRGHSGEISRLATAVENLSADIKALTRRVERIEELLGAKADATTVAGLDARIRRLEERLGLSPL